MVYEHDRIGRQHWTAGHPGGNDFGFRLGDAPHVAFRSVLGVHRLVDIGWHRVELDPCRAQQFSTAGGCRREHQSHPLMLSSRPVIPVNAVMPDALATVLRKAPLTAEKVAFAWRTAVGPAMDRVTTIELKGSVLKVRTRDAAWQREIERSAALIRTRLDALLGTAVVKGLDVSVD